MCEQLNTFILRNIIKLLFAGCLCAIPYISEAQTDYVKYILSDDIDNVKILPRKSTANLIGSDLYINCTLGSIYKGTFEDNVFSAISDNMATIYSSFVDVGVGSEFYSTQYDQLRLGVNLGYKYERFAFDKGLFRTLGMHTHWITTDVNVSWKVLCAGAKAETLLDKRIKYDETFSYQGFNDECFNNFAASIYCGLNAKFSFIKLEFRVGYYILHQLDRNAIAYYHSLNEVKDQRGYYEAKISFPIFSTRKLFDTSIITRTIKR